MVPVLNLPIPFPVGACANGGERAPSLARQTRLDAAILCLRRLACRDRGDVRWPAAPPALLPRATTGWSPPSVAAPAVAAARGWPTTAGAPSPPSTGSPA